MKGEAAALSVRAQRCQSHYFSTSLRNSKIELKYVRFGGMDWIDLAQDRDGWRALVTAVMNL